MKKNTKPTILEFLSLFCLLVYLIVPVTAAAAPFKGLFHFTQPNKQEITLQGEGDEFQAVFETTSGYTVLFDPQQKAYFYAKLSPDGKSLVSTGVYAHDPPPAGLEQHLRIDHATAAADARAKRQKWEEETELSQRWSQVKNRNLHPAPTDPSGTTPAPPRTTTTGNIVGLTLLIDFPDAPATVGRSAIDAFLNSTYFTGFGNNGSVYQYFKDVSNSQLSYTNVVTIYVRMANPKSYYNNTSYDCGSRGRLLITDALAILKARSDYVSTILPTFNTLTTDSTGQVRGFNVFFAGANSGAWSYGLWPHSWALASPVDLGNGKSVYRYQISDIGNGPTLGTFCHENGHMVCSFPDLYDYGYDSAGGAGYFSIMGYGSLSSTNPTQVDAYLKTAAGWATVTDVDSTTQLAATLVCAPDSGYNRFYRYRKPGVSTEYYLFENRQRLYRDAALPGEGIAVWHVDELGNRDNQSTTPNSSHLNYELSLVQADNLYHLQKNLNYGDASDLYYDGNGSGGYTNKLDDTSAPSSRWWDGSVSYLNAAFFSPLRMDMSIAFNAPDGFTVCGTVISGSDRTAVAGATVSIGGKSATTGSNGTFCISGLSAGTCTLTISKAGYVTYTDSSYNVTGDISGMTFFLWPQQSFSVSGTVRSGSLTGPVVSGALVSIGPLNSVTGDDGTYKITGVPAGTYTFTIYKTGYATHTNTNFVVDADKTALNSYIVPLPLYSLSGTVRSGSSTGPVLPDADIFIAGKTATTSSTGTFTITGIPAGIYTVIIAHSGYETKTVTGYVISGNSSGVVFYLTKIPTYSVSGTVRSGSSTGPVLSGATVAIADKKAPTSSTGTFTITGIPAGTYSVTISKSGYYTKTVTGYVISGNRTGVVFYLTKIPTYSVSGTVRSGSSTGPVLSGATVAIAGKTATTSSTGTFTVTGIPAGTYTVTISKSGYYTKTVTGYTISGNRTGVVFYLTKLPTYSLSGTVRSGSSTGPVLSGATVAIAGKTATTSSTGTFTITGIPAGTYTVTISKSGYYTKTVAGYAISGNRSGVVFYLVKLPTYSLSGTVRSGSSTGPVLSGATVAIAGKTATTSSTGTFTITGIPAGTYTVAISRTGYYTKTVTGYVISGNKTGVVFYLTKSG